MVYFHGGAYFFGNNNWREMHGQVVADRQKVIVVRNFLKYRLETSINSVNSKFWLIYLFKINQKVFLIVSGFLALRTIKSSKKKTGFQEISDRLTSEWV